MKTIAFCILLAVCITLVASHHFHTNRCLPAMGKYPFDEQKFSGDWYVVSRAFRPDEFGALKCDKLHYSAELVGNLTRTTLDVHIKQEDGTEQHWMGKGQAMLPGYSSTTSMAWRNSDIDEWHSVARHAVLATDYDSYALIHACIERYDGNTDDFSKMVFDQIWSRTTTLDDATIKTLKSIMSSFDLEEGDWNDVPNTDC
ncbi:hypothetical protein L9F63_023365 [Diploptera punctata]|uniref:Uncharacterized protein n=1 Tax=Diploptera punctata TaxID=6984 RepID=A0AAD7ZIZ9_DIPPU|nr:hypothetical protein L9F63_023365 [Diploptera punctata]